MDFDARKSPIVHSFHGSSEILIFSDKTEDTNPLLYFLQSIKNPLVTGKSTVARGFVLLICSRGARDIYPQVTVLKSIRNYGLKAFPSHGLLPFFLIHLRKTARKTRTAQSPM